MPEKLEILESLAQGLHDVMRYANQHASRHQTTMQHLDGMFLLMNEHFETFPEANLDKDYIVSLILVHDFGELGLQNDFTAFDQSCNTEVARLRQEYEDKWFSKIGKIYPWILPIYKDFEEVITAEAAFVNYLDHLECSRHQISAGLGNVTFAQAEFSKSRQEANLQRLRKWVQRFPQLAVFIPFAEGELEYFLDKFREAWEHQS
ncbi:MAG: HD domain-containing protein [Firmicutes bacterium]|nr:HD domain-containing protein [Bacillota bacterium]